MPRINIPEGEGEDLQRMRLLQPKMYEGVSALGLACYRDSQLPMREREAARIRIAHINGCVVCSETRALDMDAYDMDEGFYEDVDDPTKRGRYSTRERLAIEFAEGFALGKDTMTDAFWAEFRQHYTDEEIMDLAICCVCWLGAGRLNAVLDVGTSCPVKVIEGGVIMGQREPAGVR